MKKLSFLIIFMYAWSSSAQTDSLRIVLEGEAIDTTIIATRNYANSVGANNDKQKADVFQLVGDNLQLSLERDDEATKTVDLSGYDDTEALVDSMSNVRSTISGLSSENIYTDNGTLTGNRTITTGAYKMSFGGVPVYHNFNFDDNIGIDQSSGESVINFRNTTGAAINNVSSTDLIFKTANSEKVRFTSAGNVGIGTASPSEILELPIESNLKIGARTYLGGARSNGATILGYAVKAKADGATTAAMEMTSTGTGNNEPAAIRMQAGNIEFHTANSGTSGNDFDSERMTIDPDGNVGIGTTSPSAKLQVNGEAKFGHTLYPFRLNSTSSTGIIESNSASAMIFRAVSGAMKFEIGSGNNVATILGDGSFGIGTVLPSAKLDVNGSVRFGNLGSVGTATNTLIVDADGDVGLGSLSSGSDDQTIDVATHTSGGINLSLEGDGEATKTIQLISDESGNDIVFDTDGLYVDVDNIFLAYTAAWDTNEADDFSGDYDDLTDTKSSFGMMLTGIGQDVENTTYGTIPIGHDNVGLTPVSINKYCESGAGTITIAVKINGTTIKTQTSVDSGQDTYTISGGSAIAADSYAQVTVSGLSGTLTGCSITINTTK